MFNKAVERRAGSISGFDLDRDNFSIPLYDKLILHRTVVCLVIIQVNRQQRRSQEEDAYFWTVIFNSIAHFWTLLDGNFAYFQFYM